MSGEWISPLNRSNFEVLEQKVGRKPLFLEESNAVSKTCPKGFGLKLAKLGLEIPLEIPLKNKVKQKPSRAIRKIFGKGLVKE